MLRNFPSLLLFVAIAAAILPPGYPAYFGAYTALVAALLALLVYGVSERSSFLHPTSLAVLVAIGLVAISVPLVYQGPQDLMAPVLILPMLCTVALGLLARPAERVPGPTAFAFICLLSSAMAFAGGAYEHFVLGSYRPGLGNNPIHFGSLAAISGCLALVGVAASASPWRYVFFLGPIFAIWAAGISDSRGPIAGAVAMTGVGILVLMVWCWRETQFRIAMLAAPALAVLGVLSFSGSGTRRVAGIIESGPKVFKFTGGSDDIRVALYSSALDVLHTSPVVGVGLGQLMHSAQALFPEKPEVFVLENLHADWANFAAMAGGLGLVAWLLLLAAPLLLLLHPEARQDRPIVLGAILLTTGQLVLGVSNATFGILPQTTIYAVALGYFLVRARRLHLTAQTS